MSTVRVVAEVVQGGVFFDEITYALLTSIAWYEMRLVLNSKEIIVYR